MGGGFRGGGGGGGGGGNGGSNDASGAGVSIHGVPMEPTYRTIHKLYKANQEVLESCAFLPDQLGFQRCVMSLTKAYDMRGFFGGMSAYHDSQRMAQSIGVVCDLEFANDFVDGRNWKADPVMIPARCVPCILELYIFLSCLMRVWFSGSLV